MCVREIERDLLHPSINSSSALPSASPSAPLLCGDALARLRTLPDASLDALVTDPPAGIAFLGVEWDRDKGGRDAWVAWLTSVMREALRTLKPGAHALVWALPRTSHWTATALENAGFEIRDVVTHIQGQGFPHGLDVAKAIDKELDAKASAEATYWTGWNTALKPASEHWILCRKPLAERSVAAQVLATGTGALNIEGCRIPAAAGDNFTAAWDRPVVTNISAPGGAYVAGAALHRVDLARYKPSGRWPANLMLSHRDACTDDGACAEGCPVAELDRQSGWSATQRSEKPCAARAGGNTWSGTFQTNRGPRKHTDSGGASRFFYVAKASRAERNAGCEANPLGSVHRYNPGTGGGNHLELPTYERNTHPTVKPLTLMRWLIRLITPPAGVVLDPFAGSGSTLVAAVAEGCSAIGIERDPAYCAIAQARIAHALALYAASGDGRQSGQSNQSAPRPPLRATRPAPSPAKSPASPANPGRARRAPRRVTPPVADFPLARLAAARARPALDPR